MFSLLAIASLLGLLPTALSHDNGLAKIPQMGWNTWNHYACNINEYGVLTSAQQLVSECLLDLGYEYLVMDDCWSASRNSTGHLQANTTKFPRGIGPLVDEVHGMGLKFGMYSDAGKYTCGGYAGSLDHETIHAETFAAGGVDYLKYGNCFDEGRSGTANISYEGYERMTDALNATGRPILYSLCNWGEDGVWNWGSTIANSWPITVVSTITLPVRNNRCPCQTYDCALPGYHRSILNKAAPVLQKNSAQFGGWADLDMLEGGNRGMGYEEYKTHFSMWAAVKNTFHHHFQEIVALIQDPAGAAAQRMFNDVDTGIQVWEGALSNGSYAEAQNITASFSDVFVDYGATFRKQTCSWKGLWTNETGMASSQVGTVEVPSRGVKTYKMTPVTTPNMKREL